MITLDPGEPGPLYLRIATRLRSAIATGALSAGARLPSARTLSAQLGVARGTVDAAYELLAGEGAIEPRGAAGTIVSAQMNGLAEAPAQRTLGLARPRIAAPSVPLPFQRGLPALDAFPRKLWSALAAKAARATSEADLGYPDVCGSMALREEIVAYLGLARGIVCAPHQVLVTTGYQGALTLVRQVLLHPGDAVWVEDPGHPQAFQAFEVGGANLVPVPVDAEGMRVAAGIAAAPKARLAVVTPTHQSPLGMSLSLPRPSTMTVPSTACPSWPMSWKKQAARMPTCSITAGVQGRMSGAAGRWTWCWERSEAMNEQEWPESTDPWSMLQFLRKKVSDRKLRLFAVASVERIAFNDERIAEIVKTSESYADGRAEWNELSNARKMARAIVEEATNPTGSGVAAKRHYLATRLRVGGNGLGRRPNSAARTRLGEPQDTLGSLRAVLDRFGFPGRGH